MKSVVLALILSLSSLSMASALPDEAEMIEYLKNHSQPNFTCDYSPVHYIDPTADIHLVRALPAGIMGPRKFELSELQRIRNLILQSKSFRPVQMTEWMIIFEKVKAASNSDVIQDLYVFISTLESELPGVFLQSSAPCPGGVTVNNLHEVP